MYDLTKFGQIFDKDKWYPTTPDTKEKTLTVFRTESHGSRLEITDKGKGKFDVTYTETMHAFVDLSINLKLNYKPIILALFVEGVGAMAKNSFEQNELRYIWENLSGEQVTRVIQHFNLSHIFARCILVSRHSDIEPTQIKEIIDVMVNETIFENGYVFVESSNSLRLVTKFQPEFFTDIRYPLSSLDINKFKDVIRSYHENQFVIPITKSGTVKQFIRKLEYITAFSDDEEFTLNIYTHLRDAMTYVTEYTDGQLREGALSVNYDKNEGVEIEYHHFFDNGLGDFAKYVFAPIGKNYWVYQTECNYLNKPAACLTEPLGATTPVDVIELILNTRQLMRRYDKIPYIVSTHTLNSQYRAYLERYLHELMLSKVVPSGTFIRIENDPDEDEHKAILYYNTAKPSILLVNYKHVTATLPKDYENINACLREDSYPEEVFPSLSQDDVETWIRYYEGLLGWNYLIKYETTETGRTLTITDRYIEHNASTGIEKYVAAVDIKTNEIVETLNWYTMVYDPLCNKSQRQLQYSITVTEGNESNTTIASLLDRAFNTLNRVR